MRFEYSMTFSVMTTLVQENKDSGDSEHSGDSEDYDYCVSCHDPIIEYEEDLIYLVYKFEGEKRCAKTCSDYCASKHMKWLDNFKSTCNCNKCDHCQESLVGPGCVVCGNKKKDVKFIRKYISTHDDTVTTVMHYCSVPCEVKGKEQLSYTCSNCDKTIKTFEEKNNTLVCAACRLARYCSRECQVAHWKSTHKEYCKEIVSSRKPLFFDKANRFTCSNCYKKSSRELKRCTGCKKTHYCSTACQSEHWKKEHKKICKELMELTKSTKND